MTRKGPIGLLPYWINSNGTLKSVANNYMKNTYGVTSLKKLSEVQLKAVINYCTEYCIRRKIKAGIKITDEDRILIPNISDIDKVTDEELEVYAVGLYSGNERFDTRVFAELKDFALKKNRLIPDKPVEVIPDYATANEVFEIFNSDST